MQVLRSVRVVEQSGQGPPQEIFYAVCPISKCPANGTLQAFQDTHSLYGSMVSAPSVVQLLWEVDAGVATRGFRPCANNSSIAQGNGPPTKPRRLESNRPDRPHHWGECHLARPVVQCGSQHRRVQFSFTCPWCPFPCAPSFLPRLHQGLPWGCLRVF